MFTICNILHMYNAYRYPKEIKYVIEIGKYKKYLLRKTVNYIIA